MVIELLLHSDLHPKLGATTSFSRSSDTSPGIRAREASTSAATNSPKTRAFLFVTLWFSIVKVTKLELIPRRITPLSPDASQY